MRKTIGTFKKRRYHYHKTSPFTSNNQLTSAIFTHKMSCSKASPFTKDEETFIVKKFAVLGSNRAVKRAFIKEFQGVRKSRWEFLHLETTCKKFLKSAQPFRQAKRTDRIAQNQGPSLGPFLAPPVSSHLFFIDNSILQM